MKATTTPLKDGSIHLRFIKKEDGHKKYPAYMNHTILEPQGDGVVEIKGKAGEVTVRMLKLALEAAKDQGFNTAIVARISENDERMETWYKL